MDLIYFGIISSLGVLMMTIGMFGMLDAFHGRNRTNRRVDWLVGLYTFGVLVTLVSYALQGRWYFATPLALLLLPAERAFRLRNTFRRRAKVDAFKRPLNTLQPQEQSED